MYDLVVIGGGSGGLHAARLAAQFGAKVALIERRGPGGAGRYGACVPSKSLVQAARLVRQIQRAGEFGIKCENPRVDFAAVVNRVREVSEASAAVNSDQALRNQGIDVFHGVASFSAYDTVLLDGKERIEGQRFVIASGSRPAAPAIPGLSESGFLDDSSIWSLTAIPESLIVLGGGPVALELAQAFSWFGSKVTVLTAEDQILPREDPEMSGQIACHLTGDGITFKRLVTIEKVECRGNLKVCIGKDRETGESIETAGSAILCAGERLANVEELNLEAVGLHADPQHGIEVDDLLQTHAVRVFAVGDVLMRNRYTHIAEREAEVAFQNAVLRRRKKMVYDHLPWATFVDPELATVGLSESKAKAENLEYRVYRAMYADTDRARIDGRTEGLAKVVTSASGKILGASILGADASLLLQQLVLAMDAGISLGDLAESSQIAPTYGQLIAILADQQRATRMESGLRAAALRLFYGFQPRPSNGGVGAKQDAVATGAQPGPGIAADPHGVEAGHGH
jgi:pyruvate/2-oxoglutarate dehydrogenase complex dihydrolipoamide dehydrogenase (E3) component